MSRHYCEINIYRAEKDCPNDHGIHPSGCDEDCRIGCNRVARFRNPNFSVHRGDIEDHKWWLYQYNYAEWLCAEHYDEVVEDKSVYNRLYEEEEA